MFADENSGACVDVSCDVMCNQQCLLNSKENAACQCISTGWGNQCVTCPPGQKFSSSDSGTCIVDENASPCAALDAQCTAPCETNPDDFGACKCLVTGWGPQCITCPPGNIKRTAS